MRKQTDQEFVQGHFQSAKCEIVEKRGEQAVYGIFVSVHAKLPLVTGKTTEEAWGNAAGKLRVDFEANRDHLMTKALADHKRGRKR